MAVSYTQMNEYSHLVVQWNRKITCDMISFLLTWLHATEMGKIPIWLYMYSGTIKQLRYDVSRVTWLSAILR